MDEQKANVVRVAKINGRDIHGTCNRGQWQWQWLVDARGPLVEGARLQIWRLAGDTLGNAQALAQQLGPLLDVDESELVNGISGKAHSS